MWLILKTCSNVSWSPSCNGCIVQSLKSLLDGRQLKMQVVSSWIFGKIRTLLSTWGEIWGLGKKPWGAFLYFGLFGNSTLSSCLKPPAEMLSFVQPIRSCRQELSSWFRWSYFPKDAWNGHILNNSCVCVDSRAFPSFLLHLSLCFLEAAGMLFNIIWSAIPQTNLGHIVPMTATKRYPSISCLLWYNTSMKFLQSLPTCTCNRPQGLPSLFFFLCS